MKKKSNGGINKKTSKHIKGNRVHRESKALSKRQQSEKHKRYQLKTVAIM